MGEGAREEGERGWCARGRAAPASAPDAASGRPETPAVRGGLGRTRAKLRTLPPSRFPSQARGQQGQPRTFNSFLPAPKSRALACPPTPRCPRRPSCRCSAAQRPRPQRAGPRGRGSFARTGRRTAPRRSGAPRASCALPLRPPLAPPLLPGSVRGKEEDVLVRDLGRKRRGCVCLGWGARGPRFWKRAKVSEPRVPWTRAV